MSELLLESVAMGFLVRGKKDWLLRVIWVSKIPDKAMPEKQAPMMLTSLLQAKAERLIRVKQEVGSQLWLRQP